MYPLIFGVVWLIIALFTQSWEPALFGGIFVLVGFFLIIYDKGEVQSEKTIIEKTEFAAPDEENKKVKFREFGFWVESLLQVEALLCYMEQAIEIASNQGFSIGEVNVFGGVHELDTCYEVLSSQKYSSFEEAQKQLTIDFAKEKAALDGHGFTTVNFEFFTVDVSKDGVTSKISFSRGEIKATDELYEIYLNTDWNRK